MEPITIISYTLTSFFGYYIGTDMWNYVKFSSKFREIERKLDDLDIIKSRLDRLQQTIKV
jgi:hypothetical protein